MKKIISLILAIIMMSSFAFAEIPDISGLTTEELLELNHQIQLRLFSEKLNDGVDVLAGQYTVGTDIPAGSYRLIVVYPGSGGMLYVYDSADSSMYSDSSFLGEYWGVVEIGKITLEDGNIVDISNNALRFFPYVGLFN